jgi:hypothetical protein
VTERRIDFHVLKYQDSSKFKFGIFWRFFDLDPMPVATNFLG